MEQLCGHIGRRVTFTIDDEELTVDCLMCAICNGRAYGGGFLAAPEADPADGWLDVMIVRRVGRLTIAKLLGMYKSGRHFVNGQLTEEAKPYFLYRRARRVALRPADGRGPGGRAPGLSDRAVPGMPAGKGSRVCRPYGEIHHPAGDGDQGDRTGAGQHAAEAGRRTARRGRRRGPRPGQGVSRGRCGRVAARKQELRPTQNTDLTKYNLRVCCTAP